MAHYPGLTTQSHIFCADAGHLSGQIAGGHLSQSTKQ